MERRSDVYQIQVDRVHTLIEIVLEGYIPAEEMQRLAEEMGRIVADFKGREIKLKVDARTFKPASPEAVEILRSMQEQGLQAGVKRVAELVESQIVALQLNRVARESGADKILRRFWDDGAARQWLTSGESAEEDNKLS
jgi:hypothetical protein